MTYEYGVVIRRQRQGRPALWQFWIGNGCAHEAPSFLAVMNWAGERGFEAFAAGNFDELGVPEVILKRAIALAPPPPLPVAAGRAGGELSSAPKAKSSSRPAAKPAPKSVATRDAKANPKKPAKS